MRKNVGFTLFELMIVVAVVGILAAVVIGAIDERKRRTQNEPTVERSGTLVSDSPDLSKCEFLGLDSQDRSTYRCADGRVYTDR